MRKMSLAVALAATSAVGLAGCDSGLGTPSSNEVLAQLDYNLTVAGDRAKFREQDLTYLGSVGPYAVYKITGASPKLIGPYVRVPPTDGYAMASGAAHYFSAQATTASPKVKLRLHGGPSGQTILVEAAEKPQTQGGCTEATDTFAGPLPDMGCDHGGSGGGTPTGGSGGSGGSGGNDMGAGSGGGTPTGGGGSTGGCNNVDGCGTGTGSGGGSSTGGGTPSDGPGGDVGVSQIGLTLQPPPPVGSTVLVRRIALTAARPHDGSVPNICCTDNVCSLR